ncbi:SpoIID/LytB domain-containing protein [Acutalibacter intestini]|uniref:SpoIID/LytB domain-containing protein n=1 Tax=Acutalibacter intestini TaxID=3093659 RepID=UPI002AC97260|nr:SpoIID/LytB domain-containing protein [Acutalibacter sp. M00204]
MKNTGSSGGKRLLLAFLALYLILTLAPAAIYGAGHVDALSPSDSPQTPVEQESAPSTAGSTSSALGPAPDFLQGQRLPGNTAQEPDTFTLTENSTGETVTVEGKEFLAACLACEMDLSSPEEALKAQAVASYSYYSRLRAEGQVITYDPSRWLVYVPESAMRERWGEDFDQYHSLLTKVVDAVYGQQLTYGGQSALCCYFAISPGSTEAVENVWSPSAGLEHPYLQAVASPGDAFSDGYLSRIDLTEEALKSAAAEYFTEDPPDLSGPAEEWLSNVEYTPSRLVKSALLGGKKVTGAQLRAAFGLRSACFSWEYAEGSFHFTVRGWGHGVGMSQAGAVFMAKNGATYQEILNHYYTGATLEIPPSDT